VAAPSPRADRGPPLALAAIALAAFVLLAAAALAVPAPRILSDEVRYTIAAGSLAEGDGLDLRGEEYGFGPVYPTLLAAVLAVVPDRDTAYPLLKLLNALLFSLTAVPLYLLARRLLPPWWSVGVAALSLAVPSSIYVSLVLTESAAYPASALALLAVVLALERTTVTRQLAVLGAVALAYLTRAQFAVLLPAFVAALVLVWIAVPDRRPRGLRSLRELWPTAAVVVLGVVALLVPLATGSAPAGLPSAYDDLWEGYDVGSVARWLVYHVVALELLVAVVPLAVAPIVLAGLIRDARAGGAAQAAFGSAFVTANASLLLVAAAFSSTEAGLDHLHDRYLFYVVPLWLVVLAVWLHDGLPRPLLATALGAALALVLPALVPFSKIAAEEGGVGVDAVVTYLWAEVNETAFEHFPDALAGRRLLAASVVALVVGGALLPRRRWWALGAATAGVILLGSVVAWRSSLHTAGDFEAALPDERTWVDDAVGSDARVTSLYVSADCATGPWSSTGLLLTEFFNRSVQGATHVADRDGSLLPSVDARVAADGSIVREEGGPIEADLVLAASAVRLRGRLLATGTEVPLGLWRVDAPLRLRDARSTRELQRTVCERAE